MQKKLMIVARLFLGIVFLVAGINGYVYLFGLEPFIATSPEAMQLFQFDYLLVVEKSLEIICGILLLANRYVPLAIAILAPTYCKYLPTSCVCRSFVTGARHRYGDCLRLSVIPL